MRVYHGSRIVVKPPDINHSRKRVDFGAGFYVTPIPDQARGLCRRFLSIGQNAFVSVYELDENVFGVPDVKILQFDSYSEEWLDFVFSCRLGRDTTDYDIVIGGVANDKVFDTVELYFQNLISKNEALGRLKYEKPNAQICIRTQRVLDVYLHFEGSEQL
ncbi:MAG: DUF3990 domain-containing protein [Lachnospiraceae bacterium]|nr:DUF3990 domain-containing protein [Lachnospiraceae bacterium]